MPRGRKENLGDFRDLTAEEQRKIASAGGKKSVESRRKKKTLREYVMMYGEMKASKEMKDKLKQEGLPINDMTKDMEIVDALYREASEGNVAAFNAIRDIRGEKPNEKISLNGNMMNEVKIRYVGMDGQDIHFPSSEDEVDLTRKKKE